MGIPDTGADLSRLGGSRDRLQAKNFTQSTGVTDEVDHGTEVASLIGVDRPDLGVQGVAPDVGLAIARIAKSGNCDRGTISRNLIAAFAWFRKIGDVQIVNVSADISPSPALIESLRALQESGTLVVAATGNEANPGNETFPAAEPHVLGVGGALGGVARLSGRSRAEDPRWISSRPAVGRASSSRRSGAGPAVGIDDARDVLSRHRSSRAQPPSCGRSTRRGTRAAWPPR